MADRAGIDRSRLFLTAAVLCALGAGVSCETAARNRQRAQETEERNKTNTEVVAAGLAGLPAATAGDPARWGMRDWTFIDTSGTATRTDGPDGPGAYEVVATVWCAGPAPGGQAVSRRRALTLTVARGPAGGWQLNGYRIDGDEPLTFGRQAGRWVAMSLGSPPLTLLGLSVLLICFGCWVGPCTMLQYPWLAALWNLAGLGLAGYAAVVCFGTGWAVPPALLLFLLVQGGVLAAYAAATWKVVFFTVWAFAAFAAVGTWISL